MVSACTPWVLTPSGIIHIHKPFLRSRVQAFVTLSLISGEKRVRGAALVRLVGMGGALSFISGSSELVRGVALAGMGGAGALRRCCTVGRNERLGSGVGLWMFCLGVGVVLWVFCLGVGVVLLFFWDPPL